MPRDFESEDEGKRVVTADGDAVGTVESTSGSAAMITADEGLSRSVRRRLGWTEEDETEYRLETSKVDRITDDEIRLKHDL
jgi:flavin-dependent dehydrogenase